MWRLLAGSRNAAVSGLTVCALLVGAAIVVVAPASPAAPPRASSSAGGVTYHPTASFPRNVMSFNFGLHAGTISIVNSTGGPRVGADYQVTVHCATFLPHGIVYWGGPVTRVAQNSFNERGRWVFGYFKAGGRLQGRIAGEWAPTGTCYSGSTKALAGPSFPILSGVIRVT